MTGETDNDIAPGPLLARRYRPIKELGRGGMGVVWLAVDEIIGRQVAIKVMRVLTDATPPELAQLRTRMQREARAAARIRHPGVITIHDVTEEDGRPAVVMELIDGPSLDDVVAERGPLDPREAASIGAQVLDALDAAHRAGVLHRDVKPGNILLGDSRVVLTDFGIADLDAPGDGAETALTRTGQVVGSLVFLAPERAQDLEPGPAADVWSLGMTLYTAVEGIAPFHRTSAFSTLTAIVNDPLPEPGRAGPLAPILATLLHKDPSRRPSAAQARDMLTAAATATEATADTPLPPPAAPLDVPPPAAPDHLAVAAPAAETRSLPASAARPERQRAYRPGSLSPPIPPATPKPQRQFRTVPVVLAAAAVFAAGSAVYTLAAGHGNGHQQDGTVPAVHFPQLPADSPSRATRSSTPSAPTVSARDTASSWPAPSPHVPPGNTDSAGTGGHIHTPAPSPTSTSTYGGDAVGGTNGGALAGTGNGGGSTGSDTGGDQNAGVIAGTETGGSN